MTRPLASSYIILLFVLVLGPYYVQAQAPEQVAKQEPAESELLEIMEILERIARSLERLEEGRSLELLIKREESANQRLQSLKKQLADATVRYRGLSAHLEAVQQVTGDRSAFGNPANDDRFREESEKGQERLESAIDRLNQEIATLNNEIALQQSGIDDWQVYIDDMLDDKRRTRP